MPVTAAFSALQLAWLRTGLAGGWPLPAACLLLVAALAWLAGRFLWRRPGTTVAQQAELSRLRTARQDPLTRLTSRSAFIEALAAALRTGTGWALLLIDIDDFAKVNALHGHRVGDEVLLGLADRLRGVSADAAHVGRLGADRFAVLAAASGGVGTMEATALGILRSLLAPVDCVAGALTCTVSMGVVLLPEQAGDVDAALRAAGAALAHVKQAGGAGWRVFDPGRDDALRHSTALAEALRTGIPAGEVVPFYQPIVELADGRVVGLEVLARWQHPQSGLLQPDLFIPLAEAMGLTGQITQSLMRRVIADARDWPDWLYFAFNVSPGQLRELIGMVRHPPHWPEGTLDPARLEVEVTESALIEDIDVAREVIALLQSRGTRVVLDDFGIGTSNFFHLRELPFDRIKIDRSFIMDIAQDPRAEACVRAMLALGASLGVAMVAEGVKDAETERLVAALGCRFGQGFHYAEPVASRDVARLLRAMPSVRRALPAGF